MEGLVEEDEEEEDAETVPNEEEEDVTVGAITQAEKKTEKQRKREKAYKIKVEKTLKHYKCFNLEMF